MTSEQKDRVCQLVYNAPKNIMRSAGSRRNFVNDLFFASGYWDRWEVKVFVDEMRGLNFSLKEERAFFLEMFFSWIPGKGDGYESSYT